MGYKQRSTVKLLGDRPGKADRYVVTPQALLLDTGLTADAFRVGVYLLSLSDGWEINQEQMAAALGMPTRSKRVAVAITKLTKRGWLQRTDYGTGGRVYKTEYALHRSRRIAPPYDAETTSYDDGVARDADDPYDVESTPLYDVDSTSSPKYQITGVQQPGVLGSVPQADACEDLWTSAPVPAEAHHEAGEMIAVQPW
jgi:hypothetical protein